MSELYPLKFEPILKEKIWGGSRLKEKLNKNQGTLTNIGESWEISGVESEVSIVKCGALKGTGLTKLLEVYKEKLVGKAVYKKFGNYFPLLFKFIDANDYLSIQVHPDDDMAQKRHNSFGKTEAWYIVDAEPEAKLIVGFNQSINQDKYMRCIKSNSLRSALNFEEAKAGDVFFMPAGRIHATGPGILFAEVQQTSDITYRIYDWDRKDTNGNARELHTEEAENAIDFAFISEYKTNYSPTLNSVASIIQDPYFTINSLEIDQTIERDMQNVDSFVVYMAMEGNVEIITNKSEEKFVVEKGETLLIPAFITNYSMRPQNKSVKLLEVYIE